jgi:hypothetical protein
VSSQGHEIVILQGTRAGRPPVQPAGPFDFAQGRLPAPHVYDNAVEKRKPGWLARLLLRRVGCGYITARRDWRRGVLLSSSGESTDRKIWRGKSKPTCG